MLKVRSKDESTQQEYLLRLPWCKAGSGMSQHIADILNFYKGIRIKLYT